MLKRILQLLNSVRWSIALCVAIAPCIAGCGSDGNVSRDSEPAGSTPEDVESLPSGDSEPPITGAVSDSDGRTAETAEPVTSEAAGVRSEPEQKLFRPEYPRRTISDGELSKAGLVRFRADRVELITDVSTEKVEPLLPLIKAANQFWEQYFGELPPAKDGSEFGMTAFVMRDQQLYSDAGFLPQSALLGFHGRQIGAEFWMNDQTLDYYRRHLFVHEATHVFMRHLPGYAADLPNWYLEGMAEIIATHSVADDGSVDFNVMPLDRDRFRGHERIVLVQKDIAENGIRRIRDITTFQVDDFQHVRTYAWCWAVCRFLDSHPRYRDSFRKIAKELITTPLEDGLRQLAADAGDALEIEWALFAGNISFGYDFERAQLRFVESKPLIGAMDFELASDRGWQPTGVHVEKGKKYRVTATGRFTLADQPKPWISEANGISFRYVRGRPIGRLLGTVLADTDETFPRAGSMLREEPLGNDATFEAACTGTLYLRINDAWGELADNQGTLSVTLVEAD